MADKPKLLIVDSNAENRKRLSDFLSSQDFAADWADSLSKASRPLLSRNSFSFLIARIPSNKIHNPGIIEKIKSSNPKLGIILLSNFRELEPAVSLLNKGIIQQIIDPENHASIYAALKNELIKRDLIQKNHSFMNRIKKLKAEHQKNLQKAMALEEIYDSTLENLMTALDLRDVETFGHSRTVAKYSRVLAEILGINDPSTLDNIRKGALLHDIGKIAIPDSILKKTRPLSDWEWERIRLHPSLGYGLIKEIKLVKVVGNIILYHHERYDGTGYPKKLKGKDIPLEARIFALADALDAITSPRPYRKERDFPTARKEILNNSKTQFDPKVVEAFDSLKTDHWERIRFESTRLLPYMDKMSDASSIPASGHN